MRSFVLTCLIFLPFYSFSQYPDHTYLREVSGIEAGGWYRIPIPQEMLSQLRPDMHDLRLMRLGEDTIETPMLIFSEGYSKSWTGVAVKELNEKDGKFTFRYEGEVIPNRLKVELAQRNADFAFDIEGSNNRLIWEPVSRGNRVIGVVDKNVSYGMQVADFPPTEYKFYRLIWDDPSVQITGVSLGKEEEKEGVYREYAVKSWKIVNNTARRQSVISIDLEQRVPVSMLSFDMEDEGSEYIRTVDLRYSRQTVTETDGSRQYLWRDWDRIVLSSLEAPIFHLDQVTTDHIEIIVYDQDELPLGIRDVKIGGLAFEIRAMCSSEYDYEVIYGSESPRSPDYTRSRPPSDIRTATLGPERLIRQDDEAGETKSFGNSITGTAGGVWSNWGQYVIGFLVAAAILLGFRFLLRWMKKRRQH
ncbi:MAG: hypothetical protein NWR72_08675 [Bacteroidia bacterium]|nr:hypothetical protein [Bacteroidia bacterium]